MIDLRVKKNYLWLTFNIVVGSHFEVKDAPGSGVEDKTLDPLSLPAPLDAVDTCWSWH